MQYVFELYTQKSPKAKFITEQATFSYQSSVLFSSVSKYETTYLFPNIFEVIFNMWNWFVLKCSIVCKFEPLLL